MIVKPKKIHTNRSEPALISGERYKIGRPRDINIRCAHFNPFGKSLHREAASLKPLAKSTRGTGLGSVALRCVAIGNAETETNGSLGVPLHRPRTIYEKSTTCARNDPFFTFLSAPRKQLLKRMTTR